MTQRTPQTKGMTMTTAYTIKKITHERLGEGFVVIAPDGTVLPNSFAETEGRAKSLAESFTRHNSRAREYVVSYNDREGIRVTKTFEKESDAKAFCDAKRIPRFHVSERIVTVEAGDLQRGTIN